jgi:hypothetical protein
MDGPALGSLRDDPGARAWSTTSAERTEFSRCSWKFFRGFSARGPASVLPKKGHSGQLESRLCSGSVLRCLYGHENVRNRDQRRLIGPIMIVRHITHRPLVLPKRALRDQASRHRSPRVLFWWPCGASVQSQAGKNHQDGGEQEGPDTGKPACAFKPRRAAGPRPRCWR